MLKKNVSLAILSKSIPTATKPLYRLHQRLHTPKGVGRVIGIQQCPGPDQARWFYRLSDVPDQEAIWEPTGWVEEQLWPALDSFMISIEKPGLDKPHTVYLATVEELMEDFYNISQKMSECGESWKIALERPKFDTDDRE